MAEEGQEVVEQEAEEVVVEEGGEVVEEGGEVAEEGGEVAEEGGEVVVDGGGGRRMLKSKKSKKELKLEEYKKAKEQNSTGTDNGGEDPETLLYKERV